MPTNRTPINRPPRSRITPLALQLFKAMQDCEPDQWWSLHSELQDELQLMPYQWPAIADPDEGPSDYPADTGGGQWHKQAVALWRELERRLAALP